MTHTVKNIRKKLNKVVLFNHHEPEEILYWNLAFLERLHVLQVRYGLQYITRYTPRNLDFLRYLSQNAHNVPKNYIEM